MPSRLKSIARRVFVVINILAAVGYLLACLGPYLDPAQWWMFSLLGLGFAFLLITLIAFIFFWLVFKPKLVLISLVALLIGWKGISVFFAFNFSSDFEYEKSPDVLRVVHWNVARFIELKYNNNLGSQTRMMMMDQLREQDADILCMQEFYSSKDTQYYNNIRYIMKDLGFEHYYYSWDSDGYLQWDGQVIFSRHPIIDSGMIRFPRPTMPEALIYTDIAFNNDTVRIYTTHLQSVQFKKQDYESIERIKNQDDGLVEGSKNIFTKLRRGAIYRATQAEIVRDITRSSPHPYILTGDMNDVPNSYTYFTIRGKELKDAFLDQGLGIGRTYNNISPTLRIDYIFTTQDFDVLQYNRVRKNYSDHFMLVADVKLKKGS